MGKPKGMSAKEIALTGALAAAAAVAAVVLIRMDTTGRTGSGLSEDFDYDLRDLGRADPGMVLYRQAGELRSGLTEARGIAVGPDGRIYLAGDRRIRIFPAAATTRPARVREIKTDAPPQCLAVGADGAIYVGMADHVAVYDPAGARRAAWEKLGEKALLTSLAVSEDNVFAADAGHRVVLRYDTAGKLLGRIGQKNDRRNIPGIFLRGLYLDVAMAPDGLLRVTNAGRFLVEAYTVDGDREVWWGRPGPKIEDFCGCCNPVNIAILPDGGVVTCEKGLRRVKLYDAAGTFVGVVAAPQAFPDASGAVPSGAGAGPTPVLDVAADAQGRVWVLDTNTAVVRVFARKAEKR